MSLHPGSTLYNVCHLALFLACGHEMQQRMNTGDELELAKHPQADSGPRYVPFLLAECLDLLTG